MIDLNNPKTFSHLDPKNVYESTEMFVDQLEQIKDEYYSVEFYSPEYKKIKNIVICGMGGSAYGAHIALSLFTNELKVPLVLNSDYHLPGFVDENTLVMLTSYSGTTEEVLSCAEEAKIKNAKMTGFSTGGKLGEILKEKYPGFTFNPKFNPSGQPRLGTGYMVLATLILLNRLGVISISLEELNYAIEEVKSNQEEIKQAAQDLSKKLMNSIPLVFASEHLIGNAHIIRNQFNETSKSFAYYEDIPELNHHLMEGLKNPENKNLSVLFVNSDLYSEKIKKRIELTKDVISKNGIPYFEYKAIGDTKLSQTLNVLSFGGYLTLYLAVLYGQDPSLIPWVDYFKEKLK